MVGCMRRMWKYNCFANHVTRRKKAARFKTCSNQALILTDLVQNGSDCFANHVTTILTDLVQNVGRRQCKPFFPPKFQLLQPTLHLSSLWYHCPPACWRYGSQVRLAGRRQKRERALASFCIWPCAFAALLASSRICSRDMGRANWPSFARTISGGRAGTRRKIFAHIEGMRWHEEGASLLSGKRDYHQKLSSAATQAVYICV